MQVHIEPEILNEIHRISETGYPFEICGFLYGTKIGNQIHIKSIYEVANNDTNKTVHYTIPPKEYMKAERIALENDTEIVGVFHSHPDHPPKPSGRDLDDALPELSYFITAVHNGQALDTRSWRLTESRMFEEEHIEINFKNKLSKSNTQNG